MSWPTAALGEVTDIVSGATPKTDVPEYWDGDVAWATPKDLSELDGALISVTPRMISQAGLRSCAAKILPPGSVLFSSRAPIGHVAINTIPMATNQGFKSMVPKAGVLDAKFLYHWLKWNRPHLESLGNGATFKEISKRVVERVELPMPPIEEQRRIAAILDKVDWLRHGRRDVIAGLNRLAKASYLDTFGDPLANPKNLPTRTLKSLGSITTGNTPPRSDPENYGDHIEWLKSDDIFPSQLAPRTAGEWLSEKGLARGRAASAGSLLIVCIAGSRNSIGRCGLLDRPAAFNQQINAVTLEHGHPRFLLEQFRVQPELVRAKSTGGMKGLVSKSALQSVEVAWPDLGQQTQYVALLDAVDTERARQTDSLNQLDALFASLQARAFSGRL